MHETQKAQGDEPDFPEGPHIAKIMACFNEYFPNGHKEKPATQTYSSLSEFSHPNSFAFINHFEWKTDVRNMPRVSFGKPSRNLLTLCLPAANIAVMSFLDSTGNLIATIGDRKLSEIIEKITLELLDQAESAARHPK